MSQFANRSLDINGRQWYSKRTAWIILSLFKLSDAVLSNDCQVFALNEFNCDIKKQCCTDKIDEFQKSLDVYTALLKKELFW